MFCSVSRILACVQKVKRASFGALPIKMVLRWLFNLKYLVHIQEIFLNI